MKWFRDVASGENNARQLCQEADHTRDEINNELMSTLHSDALVFFGATGDLAHKKVFPSLQAMVKRGTLNVPIIGVAKSGWNPDQFQAGVLDSLEQHGGADPAAFWKLCSLIRYVDGDYKDTATFRAVRQEFGSRQAPAHYLAIPPDLFELVVEQLGKSDCTHGARVILEKPFGKKSGLRAKA